MAGKRSLALTALLALLALAPPPVQAATPGLPFTEDFSDTDLRDDDETNANWSTEEQALLLAWKRTVGPWGPDVDGGDVTTDVYQTSAVALGDVDGDGDLDLVAGNYNEANRWYRGRGYSEPWYPSGGAADVTTDVHATRSVVLGDVDGDGDLDLVVGNDGETNRLYLNNGTSDPWAGVTGSDITADAHATRSVVLGDVDGDGDLDLVTGNYGQVNRRYLNNGTSDPWGGVTGVNVTGDAHDTTSIALGDVDGDGDLDLLAGNDGEANRLYLNNGTADPWAGIAGSDVTADAHATTSVVLGDTDGDGDLDLIAGNDTWANRSYTNNGTTDPWGGAIGVDVTTDAHATTSVLLGDLDGDGDLDLVVGNDGQPNRLYVNNNTADPWNGVTGSEVATDMHGTMSIALGDVSGDGNIDLVAGNWAQVNRYYLNNGSLGPWGGPGSEIMDDSDHTRSLVLGDVDRDGDVDLITGNYNQPNRLFLNNGTADPWAGVTGSSITTDAQDTFSVALGDVDGDGDLDVVAGNYGEAQRVFLNNGTADPWAGVTGSDITTDTHLTRSIVLGDVDRDGDLDLVAGNEFAANRLYLNNGTPDPWAGVTGSVVTSDTNTTRSIALGDVDGDGDLDLVAGNVQETNRLYLNNGTSDPWGGVAGSDITADTHATNSVVLGDVDGDGDLDLLAGSWSDGIRLYLNNGTSDPWNGVVSVPVGIGAPLSLALGDVNGDGHLDIVGGGLENIRLYLNNGTSNPWLGVSGTTVVWDGIDKYSVALGDVDRDGDLDLLAGNDYARSRLYLNSIVFEPWVDLTGSDVTGDTDYTYTIVPGDVDGDGDLDLVAGNWTQPNRLYLNNGTADPWNGVTGSDISSDADWTRSAVLGDVDSDGDLDVVAGNEGQPNRLYLNNGTADPWNGVSGSDITSDAHDTLPVALGDVDRDGDLDLVAGNWNQANRLYLNNGTADPWSGVTGSNIAPDTNWTRAVVLGDVDRDGDLDLVAGNVNQANRLYLNNGTSDPWFGVTGSDITADTHWTRSVVLSDVDHDGDLDLVAGNENQPNRLYLNNGTADPWDGVTGSDITPDVHFTRSVALSDVDRDGDLDLLAGNDNQANRLYLNNGTADPWAGVTGSDVTDDAHKTTSIVLADADADGDIELVAGNEGQANRMYLSHGVFPPAYDTGRGRATSLEVDTVSGIITNATLTSVATLPANTWIDYWLSNDGGAHWELVEPGMPRLFSQHASDLRWRAELHSLSPALTPRIDQIQITSENPGAPITIGDRVWEDLDGDGIQDAGEPGLVSAHIYLYDDQDTLLDWAFTDSTGNYSFSGLTWHDQVYKLRFVPWPGHHLAPRDQGSDDGADSDPDPATGYTDTFNIFSLMDDTRWDAGMVPTAACTPPDETVYLYTLTVDGNGYTVLHFMDPNQPDQITGYNIYRSSDAGLPHDQWTLLASDIIDMDEGTPNKQWVDTTGDPGDWYYQVAGYNHRCPAETAEGPW
jgi:hypothetical protein